MPRRSHPWFRKSDGWWYIKIGGEAEKLARGRENREAAVRRWHELAAERAANRATDDPVQTVASVIDIYLSHSERHYSPESYANRRRYLQLFAEAHGFRSVCECRPMHLTVQKSAECRDKLHGIVFDGSRANINYWEPWYLGYAWDSPILG